MIDGAEDGEVQDMARAVTTNPQWISRMQVSLRRRASAGLRLTAHASPQTGCLARRLFETLEGRRANYFRNVTEEELEDVPPTLFIHLP